MGATPGQAERRAAGPTPPDTANPPGTRGPLFGFEQGVMHSRQGPSQSPATDMDPEDEEDSAFLGESTSISCLNLEPTPPAWGPSPPKRLRLLHVVSNAAEAANLVPPWELERRQARVRSLQAEGVFSRPSPTATEALLRAYFKWFHSYFAIVEESDVWSGYRQNTLSPLPL